MALVHIESHWEIVKKIHEFHRTLLNRSRRRVIQIRVNLYEERVLKLSEGVMHLYHRTPKRLHAYFSYNWWTLADIHWIIEFCVFFTKVTTGLLQATWYEGQGTKVWNTLLILDFFVKSRIFADQTLNLTTKKQWTGSHCPLFTAHHRGMVPLCIMKMWALSEVWPLWVM